MPASSPSRFPVLSCLPHLRQFAHIPAVTCLQSIELLYLRAICHHALGYARKAVADYDACMAAPLRPEVEGPLAEEAR